MPTGIRCKEDMTEKLTRELFFFMTDLLDEQMKIFRQHALQIQCLIVLLLRQMEN